VTTLVGLVPGERGLAALHLGALLARSFGSDLVVATVVPTPWPVDPNRPVIEYLALQEKAARAALEQATAVIGAETPTECIVHRARSVSSGLLELAQTTGAARVALGSSTSGPLGRVSLGTIADRVLHGSGASLSVAPAGFTASTTAQVERFTVGFGRHDGDGALLSATASAAQLSKAALRIACFAVRPMTALGGSIEEDAEDLVVDEWAKHLGEDISKAMTASGLAPIAPQVESVVGQGTSWPEALADVDWAPHDVLVVGSSTSPFSRFLLGSHASKIVRSSPVPVLVVPRSHHEPVAVPQ
jgi:nucleotide-binding universal stress UspA family protein